MCIYMYLNHSVLYTSKIHIVNQPYFNLENSKIMCICVCMYTYTNIIYKGIHSTILTKPKLISDSNKNNEKKLKHFREWWGVGLSEEVAVGLRSEFLALKRSCACVLSCFQSCLTLCHPVDCSPPGSSVHRILQARILEWVAMPTSRNLPDPRIKPKFPASPALQVDSLYWAIGKTLKRLFLYIYLNM